MIVNWVVFNVFVQCNVITKICTIIISISSSKCTYKKSFVNAHKFCYECFKVENSLCAQLQSVFLVYKISY